MARTNPRSLAVACRVHCRPFSSSPVVLNGPQHFYRNKQLEQYAAKPANRLTLRQLVFFGRSMTEERLLKSANYVRTELPVRIAHRIRDMQTLPYVVVTEDHVAKVYELYWTAFDKIRNLSPIKTLEDNDRFCTFLKGLLDEHLPVIPNLSLGLSISSPHLSPDKLDSFMRRMLVSRISRRVLAEHHLALSDHFTNKDVNLNRDHVGIIYTDLSVKDSIDRCLTVLNSQLPIAPEFPEGLKWPEVVVDGDIDTKFSYIKEHLDYVIYELLHNAMLATSLRHCRDGNSSETPTVLATIVAAPDDVQLRISDQGGGLSLPCIEAPSDLYSFSHIRNSTRLEGDRINALQDASDHEGIKGTVEEKLAKFEEQDLPKEPALRPPRRFGLGLPMSNIFATYFGGSLDLVSLDGHGMDVYLRLPKLGTNLEGVEL